MATLADLSSPECLYDPFAFCGAWFFPAPVHLELCAWYNGLSIPLPTTHALTTPGALLALGAQCPGTSEENCKERGLYRDPAMLGGRLDKNPGAERLASASL